jgi:ribosomal protein S20
LLHKSAGKGVIHRKKADRKISRLSRQVHQMASA